MLIFPDEILLLIAIYSNYKTTISLLKTNKFLSSFLHFNHKQIFWNSKISSPEHIINNQECHHINHLIINVNVLQQIIDGYKYNLILTIFRYRPKYQKKVIAVLVACKNIQMTKFIINNCKLNEKALKYISQYYETAHPNNYNLSMLKMLLKTNYNLFNILSITISCTKDQYYDIIIQSAKFIPHQHLQQCTDHEIIRKYNKIVTHSNYNERQMFAIAESGYNNNLHQFYIHNKSLNYIIHVINKDLLALFFLNLSYISNPLSSIILLIITNIQYIKLLTFDETILFTLLFYIVGDHAPIIALSFLIYFCMERSYFKLLYTSSVCILILLHTHNISFMPAIMIIILNRELPPNYKPIIRSMIYIRIIANIYNFMSGDFIDNMAWHDLTLRLIGSTVILFIREPTPIIIIPEFICISLVIYIFCFYPHVFVCLSLFFNLIFLNQLDISPYLSQLKQLIN